MADELELWRLIWKQHDLEGMLVRMPELEAEITKKGELAGHDYAGEMKKICATWTIQARYSSRVMRMDEATDLLERVRRLKEILK